MGRSKKPVVQPTEVIQSVKPSVRVQTDAKIAFLDIETAPGVGHVWGKWEQDVIEPVHDGYIMSYSFKIAGQKKVKVRGLPDYPETWEGPKDAFDCRPRNDSALVKELWDDLNSVDIIIAHNGDRFDIPWVYARFMVWRLAPPKPFQSVDTLKIFKYRTRFVSNKLDDLCHTLGIGRKLPHTGKHLWLACVNGVDSAWHLMKRYNRHDVLLLEELYYRALPYAKAHPNVNKSHETACPRCGAKNFKLANERWTLLRKKHQFHCLNCTCWFEGAARKA